MIDKETQQKIKDAANIVEVVGDYVKLTRKGANYMGLCPFHNEKTPSFSVSPQRNFCHCFSCKKGGSPVNFLMEKEGIGYTEALMLLAKKYNIPVEDRELSDEERARMSEREAMMVASEWAMQYFHNNLYNTEEGRDIGLAYLYGRGVTDESIKKYKLGYSIDRGDALISKARSEGFDIEVFKKLGLVGTSQQGREYDKMRGRVIFPIRNASGKAVAYGARALKGEAAKYLNSPEMLLYHKSNELYGIFEAKAEAIKQDRIYLMEGYFDVIGSWQSGIRNAVASSGTALTESQIALIHRFTDNVTLIYDGDAAGIKAAMRGINMLLSQKLHVKVLLLPDGEDPDSFARKHTPKEFVDYIESHQTDFIRYIIDVLLKDADGNPQLISEAVKTVVASIACIPDEIERISYIKECARLTDYDEKVLTRQVATAMLTQIAINKHSGQYQQPSTRVIPDNSSKPEQSSQPTSTKTPERSQTKEEVMFNKQEEEILKYCIRYGFLTLKENGETSKSVLDYVATEMEADGISFSNPIFQKVFDILEERKKHFANNFDSFKEEIDKKLAKEREFFRQQLIIEGGSMAKIKREEKKYSDYESRKREEELRQFAISFSIAHLLSHEEDEVRQIATRLVAERHTLSRIYSEGGYIIVKEEDRISDFLPRALSELRSEILNRKVQELQTLVAKAIEENDREEQQRLMGKLSKLFHMRSKIAENLGERIISPRK